MNVNIPSENMIHGSRFSGRQILRATTIITGEESPMTLIT